MLVFDSDLLGFGFTTSLSLASSFYAWFSWLAGLFPASFISLDVDASQVVERPTVATLQSFQRCIVLSVSLIQLRPALQQQYVLREPFRGLANGQVAARRARGCGGGVGQADRPRMASEPEPARLFVRNLSYGTTEEELAEAFEAHGALAEVHLVKDRQTGQSKVRAHPLARAPWRLGGHSGDSIFRTAFCVDKEDCALV